MTDICDASMGDSPPSVRRKIEARADHEWKSVIGKNACAKQQGTMDDEGVKGHRAFDKLDR